MRQQFVGFYQPSIDDFKELWRDATFVLDTNVLLNLYRYPEKAREDLLGLFESVKGRLWLPYQVALEYHRNRPLVIAEQKGRFAEVRKIITTGIAGIENGLAQLQLRDRHSSINPDPLISNIKPIVEKYLAELNAQETSHVNVHGSDPLQKRLDTLFADKIGPKPDQGIIDEICKLGADRYKHEVPPGFCDEKKEKSEQYSYDGVMYTPKYGDFVLWRQIIEFAKTNKKTSIIFLTDDEKEDWWWKVKSQGEKNLGPHPCLVAEIAREANVTRFYMYNSGQFLKYSREYLDAKVSEESIDQVKDIADFKFIFRETTKNTGSDDEISHSRRLRDIMRQLLHEVRPYTNVTSQPLADLDTDRDSIELLDENALLAGLRKKTSS